MRLGILSRVQVRRGGEDKDNLKLKRHYAVQLTKNAAHTNMI